MADIGFRIRELRRYLNMNQKEFAEKIGISRSRLSEIESNKGKPNRSVLLVLQEKLNVNPDWLLTGEGEMFLDSPKSSSKQDDNIISCKEAAFFLVPKVKARLTAGTGTLETSSEVTGRYAFRLDWLHTITTSPKSLVLMEVYGDSMEPEIKDGDTVMVDQSQKEIIIGKIYAVGFGEEIVIKQVYKEPDKLILKSINKEYRPIELPADEWQDRIRIIGRVVWWCREG